MSCSEACRKYMGNVFVPMRQIRNNVMGQASLHDCIILIDLFTEHLGTFAALDA